MVPMVWATFKLPDLAEGRMTWAMRYSRTHITGQGYVFALRNEPRKGLQIEHPVDFIRAV